jgi:hypothetical protein
LIIKIKSAFIKAWLIKRHIRFAETLPDYLQPGQAQKVKRSKKANIYI